MPKSAREKETKRTCGNEVEGIGRDEDDALGPENARRSSKWTIRQEQNGPDSSLRRMKNLSLRTVALYTHRGPENARRTSTWLPQRLPQRSAQETRSWKSSKGKSIVSASKGGGFDHIFTKNQKMLWIPVGTRLERNRTPRNRSTRFEM